MLDQQQEMEEAWVLGAISDNDLIIKEYGIKYFMENLNSYSKIAIISYLENIRRKNVNAG
jgi:hypothetical protein